MPLTDPELAEYMKLHNGCGCVLLYPAMYRYSPGEDSYTEINDKHEWHPGADVRRLRELAERIEEPQRLKWLREVGVVE